jgi:glutathione S-transferase
VLDYASTMKAPTYLAINPMGKVPALRHGDTIVTENAAICAYLADAFPQAGLAPPAGHKLRGPYYRWLFFAAGPLEAAVSNKALGFVVPPERERMIGYGTLALVLNTLEAAVSRGDYIAGDRFSAADVYVGSHIGASLLSSPYDRWHRPRGGQKKIVRRWRRSPALMPSVELRCGQSPWRKPSR